MPSRKVKDMRGVARGVSSIGIRDHSERFDYSQASCIFCQIAAGKVPCYKLYEDKEFLAFLDIKPLRKGHVLTIPKKHYRWVHEVPNFGKYFEFVKKVMMAQKEAFNADSVSIGTVGHDIDHAHVHTIPRMERDKGFVRESNVKETSPSEMERIAAKIRKYVK